ncbi:unnamed protein product, partial [Lampetra fluviatilis]
DCYTCIGEDYRGKMSRTETGRECQRWDQLVPHRHIYQPDSFPNGVNNYCRNPDGEPRPWCYTMDPEKRWEYCAVAKCVTTTTTITPPPPFSYPEGLPPTNPGLEVTLTCVEGRGEGYRGTVSVTVSGRTCQAWDSQSPHAHRRRPEVYSCKGLEANYCRNPDGEKLPWCYTTDPERRWEYCDVPSCTGGPTASGEKCGVQVEMPKVCMGRIVGGCPAKPHSWPWQVAIRKKLYSFSRPHCGATLIDPSWILTAAHCVNSSDVRLYRVLLGVHNELAPSREDWQTVLVQSIHTEPRGVDIALVKIAPCVPPATREPP